MRPGETFIFCSQVGVKARVKPEVRARVDAGVEAVEEFNAV